jgi:hypothetical protein
MRLSLAILVVLGLAGAPSTAHAIEVMCENEAGVMCTIDGAAGTYDCTCEGAPVGGTTGGSENPWADLDEAELMAACEDLLPPECAVGESSGGSSDTDVGTGPATTTPDTNGTDPSGPASDTGENETNAGTSGEGTGDDDDDDDKGCTIGGHAGAPVLAMLAVLGWRRRVRSLAG